MTELDIAPNTPETSNTKELVPTPENTYGDYETIKLPVGAYIKMAQIRGERSPVANDIKDSILNSGLRLISRPHVARMTEENLREYIGFVNRVWGAETSFDTFANQQQADGYYYLIIDGHTRHQALQELEDEGKIQPSFIAADIHEINSPEDIIEFQMNANIHAGSPRERRAIALVESYEWGLETGRWKNKADYIKKHRNVSASFLREAVSFSNLSKEARDYVFTNHVPYAAAVSLGAAIEDYRDYLIRKTGLAQRMTKKRKDTLDRAVKQKLAVELQTIANARMNSTAAEKHVRAVRQTWQPRPGAPADESGQDPESQPEQDTLFDVLKSADELLEEELAANQRDLAGFIRKYSLKPGSAAAELIGLALPFIKQDAIDEVYDSFRSDLESAQRHLGSRAQTSSALSTLMDEQEDGHGPTEQDIMDLEQAALDLAQ